MTDTRVALGSDRLPWLTDAPKKRSKARERDPLLWGAAAVLLVAGTSYWLGMRSIEPEPVVSTRPAPTVTTPLPETRTVPPAAELPIASTPEVEPVPAPEVRQAPAPIVRQAPARPKTETATKKLVVEESEKPAATAVSTEKPAAPPAASAAPAASKPAVAPARSLALWPSRVTAGAYGRMVQIGAFGTRHQAKLGWRHMARAYPGVKRLPAVVVETRNSRGRKFYRFQIGTTSQAHSEVLCQRMQKIRFSCAVVGLPWKPRGVER